MKNIIHLAVIVVLCMAYELNPGIEMLDRFGRGIALAAIFCNLGFFIVTEIRERIIKRN